MKPTEYEIKLAKDIVKDLVENKFLNAVISEDNDGVYDWSHEYRLYLEDRGFEVHYGESKACIISDELPNWVIKVGFTYPFPDGTIPTDFCTIEEKNYQRAIVEGLEDFFAATYKLCEVTPSDYYSFNGNITFFIQEMAEPDEYKTSCTCDNYMNRDVDKDEEYYYDYDDYDRLESLFAGTEKLDELFDFVRVWKIDDLHSGNFGYAKNGKVKIIDFSGYHE